MRTAEDAAVLTPRSALRNEAKTSKETTVRFSIVDDAAKASMKGAVKMSPEAGRR